jgi:hypothetical protein
VLPVRYELNFICYIEESRPSLWRSGQSSWLQIRRSRNALYTQTLVLTLPTSGGCSVGIVHSRTKATEYLLVVFYAVTSSYGYTYVLLPLRFEFNMNSETVDIPTVLYTVQHTNSVLDRCDLTKRELFPSLAPNNAVHRSPLLFRIPEILD